MRKNSRGIENVVQMYKLCTTMEANSNVYVSVRILDATEIKKTNRKQKKVYSNKIIVIRNGCRLYVTNHANGHDGHRRQIIPIEQADGWFVGSDGSQHFSVHDIRRQLKPLFLQRKVGKFDIPLMISDFPPNDGLTASCSKFEILNYLPAPVDHAMDSLVNF